MHSQGILPVGLLGFFLNLYPCLPWKKAGYFCTQNKQIFDRGKTCFMTMTVKVLNKDLGRQKYENGRRLRLGPAGVSERFRDLPCAKISQKNKSCLCFMQTICHWFFLWNNQNPSLAWWKCVHNAFYQHECFMARAKHRCLWKQLL